MMASNATPSVAQEPTLGASTRPRWMEALFAGAIVVITLLAYLPVLVDGGFIWDDDDYVTENQYLRDTDGLAQIWVPRKTHQYYPVVFTTFWIEYQLWELNPTGYHLINVLIHIANALLVWRLALFVRIPGALALGLVFALHPVHVESVAWITERKNVLSGLFYLLALGAYLKFALPASTRRWAWYTLAMVLFVGALLSKSVTASLPVAIVIIMLFQRRKMSAGILASLAPMLVLGFIAGWHTGILEREVVGATGPEFDFSFADRIAIAGNALVFYPWKLLAPHPIMFNYPRLDLDASFLSLYWPVAVIAVVGVAALMLFRRGHRSPALGLAFYAATILPALGLVNIYPMRYSFVADHFQYLASLGVLALVISIIAAVLKSARQQAAVAALVGLGLFVFTWQQAAVYRSRPTPDSDPTIRYDDSEALYRDTIAKNPLAWMPLDNLAAILLRKTESAIRHGDREAAVEYAAEAALRADAALAVRSDLHTAHSNLSEAMRVMGNYEGAIEHMKAAAANKPEFPPHLINLGHLYELTNQPDQAIEVYLQAIGLVPETTPVPALFRLKLAAVLEQRGDLDEAVAEYAAILEIDPLQFSALSQLARINLSEGNYHAAKNLYQRAIEAVPSPGALLQISRMVIPFLAYCPDPAYRDLGLATRLAEHCVKLTREQDPQWLGTLDLLYGEAGRFEEAVRAAELALQLARQYPELNDMAKAIEQRLQSYRAGQPWREQE